MNAVHPLLTLALLASLAAPGAAQTPQFDFEEIGWNGTDREMNSSGQIAGFTYWSGITAVATVTDRDGVTFLPMPAGMQTCEAHGINDQGLVVGRATVSVNEWRGVPVLWTPDGAGGYTVELLQLLPGHVFGAAYDINDRGDIIGVSFVDTSTTWRAVQFRPGTTPLNLSVLGAPIKANRVNDRGLVLFEHGDVMFDLDTMTAVPYPAFPPGQTNFHGHAINDFDEFVGVAYFGDLRSIASWTQASGWQELSPRVTPATELIGAGAINNHGWTVFGQPAAMIDIPLLGTFPMETLLPPSEVGIWNLYGGKRAQTLNDAGWFSAQAGHTVTPTTIGGIGLFLPQPSVFAQLCVGDGTDVGCPCANFSLADSGAGCMHSQGHGAWLTPTGTPLVSADDFRLHVSRARPSQTAVLLQGEAQVAIPFRDGVLCTGSPTERIERLGIDAAGAAATSLSIVDEGNVAPGETRYYQVWFRDPGGVSACGTGSNFTNAVGVDWQ